MIVGIKGIQGFTLMMPTEFFARKVIHYDLKLREIGNWGK